MMLPSPKDWLKIFALAAIVGTASVLAHSCEEIPPGDRPLMNPAEICPPCECNCPDERDVTDED
jgi:hypothetical protein